MIVEGLVGEVWAGDPDGGWSCGSGYLVGGRLVLTAAHVVAQGDRPASSVRVRWLGEDRLIPARVVWSGRPAGLDVALLAVDEAPAARRPVRWGRLVGSAAGVACGAVGFPAVVAGPDRVRDTEHMRGTINPLALSKSGLHAVTVLGAPQRVRDSASPWAGMSGAAVFCAGLVTAVVVRDPAGYASGRLVAVPVAGCLADPAFVSLLEHAGVPAWPEPVELVGLLADPAGVDSPASLLRADVAAVRFRGRGPLLEELKTWCEGRDDQFGVQLVVGPGGQGKTRLGDELARRLRRAGWVAGRVVDGAPAAAVAALTGLSCDVLLVVDYAESRAEHVQQLIEQVRQGVTRARLLLLARTAGDWVGELAARAASTSVIELASVRELGPVDTDQAGRVQAWQQAVDDIAARLPAVPGYSDVAWPDVAAQVGVMAGAQPLAGLRDTTVLAVQMHALAALLQAGRPQPGPAAAVETVLLQHEQRYWSRTAQARGLVLDPVTYRRAVTAATVWSAADEPQARRLVAALPGLRDLGEDRHTAAIGWLASLYPSQGRFWGGLQPDRLGEHLAGIALAEAPALLAETAAAASTGQMEHAMTVLARAAVHQPHLAATIADLITRHPEVAGPAAITVIPESDHPDPLLTALTGVVDRAGVEHVGLLQQLAGDLPEHTLTLREFAAHLMVGLVDIQRQLVRARPDAFLPDLAGSLNNLSVRLGELGRREDGLAAIEEAVTVYRELVRARPDAFLPALAMSLNNLSLYLGELGRREDGLATIEEAVTVYRELVRARPDAFLPALAASLNNLSLRLAGLGRREDGLAAIEEAVTVYRELVRARPDAFLPDLAQSLRNFSRALLSLGRQSEAQEAAAEVERIG